MEAHRYACKTLFCSPANLDAGRATKIRRVVRKLKIPVLQPSMFADDGSQADQWIRVTGRRGHSKAATWTSAVTVRRNGNTGSDFSNKQPNVVESIHFVPLGNTQPNVVRSIRVGHLGRKKVASSDKNYRSPKGHAGLGLRSSVNHQFPGGGVHPSLGFSRRHFHIAAPLVPSLCRRSVAAQMANRGGGRAGDGRGRGDAGRGGRGNAPPLGDLGRSGAPTAGRGVGPHAGGGARANLGRGALGQGSSGVAQAGRGFAQAGRGAAAPHGLAPFGGANFEHGGPSGTAGRSAAAPQGFAPFGGANYERGGPSGTDGQRRISVSGTKPQFQCGNGVQ